MKVRVRVRVIANVRVQMHVIISAFEQFKVEVRVMHRVRAS